MSGVLEISLNYGRNITPGKLIRRRGAARIDSPTTERRSLKPVANSSVRNRVRNRHYDWLGTFRCIFCLKYLRNRRIGVSLSFVPVSYPSHPATFGEAYEAAISRFGPKVWASLRPPEKTVAIYQEMRRIDEERCGLGGFAPEAVRRMQLGLG